MCRSACRGVAPVGTRSLSGSTGRIWIHMHVNRHWGAAVAALTALALVSQVLYGVTSAAAWGRPVAVLVQAASIQESSPTKSVVAQCPAGKKVTGGGGGITT